MRFTVTSFSLLVGASALLGCSNLKLNNSAVVDRKTFQIQTDWVVSGPKDNLFVVHKINRMRPLLFSNAKVDLVIQGNSVDGLVAYQRKTGWVVWRLPIVNGIEGSATLNGDRLYVGALNGQLYSVNAETGQIVWSFPTRIENLAEPLVADGLVFVLAGNGSLYALEEATGQQVWLYSRQDPNSLNVRGGSKPALHKGNLFVGFSDGSLVSLNAKTGQLKWEKQLNPNKKFRDLDTDPYVDSEYVYALGFDDRLYCLRSATGELVWKADAGGYGGFLVKNDRLFYATSGGEFVAVDRSTGRRIWAYKLTEGLATSGAFYRGLIVIGESQGALVFLESGTGGKVGSFEPGQGVLSPPTVDEARNRVYFISGEANVYAMNIGFKLPPVFPSLR